VEKSNGKDIENLTKYPKAKMDDLVKANNNNQLSGQADYLETDPEMLSDDVLSENIEILEQYFTSDGWEKLNFTLKEKVKKSTCFICKRLCLSGCIQCSRCHFWLHFKCEYLDESKFSDNHESVVWNCIKFDTDVL
ncbi:unnamed protein product, partial [Brachionus calyciflorus]